MSIPSVFLYHTCDIVSTINGVVQRIDITDITPSRVVSSYPALFDRTIYRGFAVDDIVTGSVSGHTATIHTVGDTYLLLVAVSGDFVDGETLTGMGGTTATASGANYDATDSFGVPITTPTTQTNVPCVFFGAGGTLTLNVSGEVAVEKPTVIFSSGISVYEGDQITGTSEGFTTTYTAQNVEYVYLFTEVYMKVVTLEAVN